MAARRMAPFFTRRAGPVQPAYHHPGIGMEAQLKLKGGEVLVIGIGWLGSPACFIRGQRA